MLVCASRRSLATPLATTVHIRWGSSSRSHLPRTLTYALQCDRCLAVRSYHKCEAPSESGAAAPARRRSPQRRLLAVDYQCFCESGRLDNNGACLPNEGAAVLVRDEQEQSDDSTTSWILFGVFSSLGGVCIIALLCTGVCCLFLMLKEHDDVKQFNSQIAGTF